MALLAIIGVGVIGFFVINLRTHPKEATIGVLHSNQGQLHISPGQKHIAYNSQPATSGPHRNDSQAPTPWGIYTQEIPPEVYLHNEEHGGIFVSYNPTLLPADQLTKLQQLFASPYSNKSFKPTKAIVGPLAADTHAIQIGAWTYTLNMDSYDEATLVKFYYQHEGKAPEPAGGPNNMPINQAKNQ